MKPKLDKLIDMAKRAKEPPEFVEFGGFILPRRSLRFCGEEFQDDAYFLKSARLEARRLVEHCGLSSSSRVLDVGSASGRLAIGILAELGEIGGYTGLDVHAPSIEWAKRYIQKDHPAFHFVHVDLANERYNPDGQTFQTSVHLPVDDGSADVINLYSVFSHMTYGDVVAYLDELRRVVSSTGHVFLTAFVEEDVPNYSVNPHGYREDWSGALHCVRFQKGFFEGMLGEAGFRVDGFEYGRETNGQSAYYLSPDG